MFRIILPALKQWQTGNVHPTVSQMGGDAAVSRSVLVVEDEESIRMLAEKILSMKGYAVKCAADGEAAMDVLDRNPDIDLEEYQWLTTSRTGCPGCRWRKGVQ